MLHGECQKWVEGSVHQFPVNGVVFDVDKLQACSIDDGVTVVHSNARRGYGLADIGMKSGCYEWKVALCSNSFVSYLQVKHISTG